MGANSSCSWTKFGNEILYKNYEYAVNIASKIWWKIKILLRNKLVVLMICKNSKECWKGKVLYYNLNVWVSCFTISYISKLRKSIQFLNNCVYVYFNRTLNILLVADCLCQ